MVRYAKNPLTTEQQLSLKQKSFVESISIFEKACHNFENTKMWSHYINFRHVLHLFIVCVCVN